MSHRQRLFAAVETYSQKGWRIYPLRPCDASIKNDYVRMVSCKQPSTLTTLKHSLWLGLNAKQLCNRIIRHNAEGIAVHTGRKSGLAVLDVDWKYGGDATLKNLNLPTTLSATTPNGKHFYYQYPKNITIGQVEHWLPGIDLMGEGGAVILPPSKNVDGIEYRWDDDSIPIAPFPEFLLKKAASPAPARLPHFIRLFRNRHNRIAYHKIMQVLFGGVPADWKWKQRHIPQHYVDRQAIITAAEQYHQQGWKVLALKPPIIPFQLKSWMRRAYCKQLHQPRDLFRIARINQNPGSLRGYFMRRKYSNMAILTGQASGIIVIDVDPPANTNICELSLPLPKTRKVITPRGYHLYYQLPADMCLPTVVNLFDGIDVQGENSYVMAPPSLSAVDQTHYCWQDESTPIAMLPEAWVDILKKYPHRSAFGLYLSTKRRSSYDLWVHVALAKLFNHHPQGKPKTIQENSLNPL